MNYTLTKVKKYFNANRQQFAGMMLLFLSMKPGDTIKTDLGNITKEDDFTLKLDSNNELLVEKLTSEWNSTDKSNLFGF